MIEIDDELMVQQGVRVDCFDMPDTLMIGTTNGLLQLDPMDVKISMKSTNILSIAKMNYSQIALAIL